jgi:hypothetical protein
MTLSDVGKNYVFTTKVYLDEGKKDYIEIREPSFTEYQQFTSDGTHNAEVMKKILPACIVSSTIVDEAGNPATGKQITDELYKSGTTTERVLEEWVEACPFQQVKENNKK